jgi:hypothetical protein
MPTPTFSHGLRRSSSCLPALLVSRNEGRLVRQRAGAISSLGGRRRRLSG